MASRQELEVLMKARDEASQVLAQVNRSLAGTQQELQKTSRMSDIAKTAFGAVTGVVATQLIGALGAAARAAAEDAASTARLSQVVENSGEAFALVEPAIAQRIALGQQLAFTDDQVRDSLATLVQASGSVDQALKLQTLSMDLARAKNIDLEAASLLVAKASAGQTGALSRMGIVLKEGATATDALAKLQEISAGAAETHAKTTAASIFRMQDAIEEWKESIGAALGPAQQYIALLPAMTDGMKLMGGAVGGVLPHLGSLKVTLLTSVIPAIGATVVAMGPILLVIAAVGLAILALKWAWDNNLGDIQGKARAFVSWLQGWASQFIQIGRSIVEGLWRGIQNNWHMILGPFGGLVRGLIENAKSLLGSQSHSRAFEAIGSTIPEGVAVGIRGSEVDAFRAARSLAMGTISEGKRWLAEGNAEVVAQAAMFGLSIPRAIGAGIASSTAIEDALKKKLEEIAQLIEQGLRAAEAATVGVLEKFNIGGGFRDGRLEVRDKEGKNVLVDFDATTGRVGKTGQVAPGQLPRFWTEVGGVPVPIFQSGGVMPFTGLAHLERGERVIPAGQSGGLTIVFNAPIYGLLDFEQQIKRIVRDTFPAVART